MEPLTWFLIVAVVLGFYAYVKYRQGDFDRQGIPHHKGILFYMKIGRQTHIIDETNNIYFKYRNSGKPFAGMYFFLQATIVLLDLEVIRDILIRDFGSFSYRRLYHNPRDDPLMSNLAVVDGDKWKKLRAKLTPTFTAAKMKFMFPTVVAVGKRLDETLSGMLKDNNILDVKELTACFTTDIIASVTLGIECNSLKEPSTEFREIMRKLFDNFNVARDIYQQAFPKLARFLRCTNTPQVVTDYYLSMVKSAIEYRQRENIRRQDFLQLMIDLYISNEKDYTIENIAAQVFIFILAGFETSATTLDFCLYQLSLHPEIQERARETVLEVLEECNGELTYDTLKDLSYLEQIINETLRLHPSAPALKRVCTKDYEVPNTKYKIKKDTIVIVPIEAIHRDPQLFPEPEKFDPERFNVDEVQQRHPMSFLPFGDGPRNCIGKRFGYMQTLIGLVYLLKNYRFSLAPSTPVPVVYDNKILLRAPKGKFELKVERI